MSQQVKIQRKGHPVEVLTDPTYEQCFNAAGEFQCSFIGVTHSISLPVTSAPPAAARNCHKSDYENKAPVEYGFAHKADTFGKSLPLSWTVTDGAAALYRDKGRPGVIYDGPTFFNLRPSGAPTAAGVHCTMVDDGQ
jgi:hypothetical protein